jgi:hypothetical protein
VLMCAVAGENKECRLKSERNFHFKVNKLLTGNINCNTRWFLNL